MTTNTAAQQAMHDDLYATDRHCSDMGGNCTRVAVVDIDVRLDSGRDLTLRLCRSHGRRTAERGLANATVVAVRAI